MMKTDSYEHEVSPWRTPDVLAVGRKTRVTAMKSACRGPRFCYVDLKIVLFIIPHTVVPLVLWYLDTWLKASFVEGIFGGSNNTVHTIRACCYTVLLCLAVIGYWKLYASEPGSLEQSANGSQLPPCRACGLVPTLRSRHCRMTGACIHKMDHYCWVLSTTIGDRNHRLFFFTVLVHVVMMWWAVAEVYSKATPCVLRAMLGPRPSFCFFINPWLFFLMCVMAVVGPVLAAALTYLLVLHVYLVCTNQTTVELLKGHSMPFLYPFYIAHRGPLGYPVRGPRDFIRLLVHEARGTGPPKPFNEGLRKNLWVFFCARKPYDYQYKVEIPSFTDIQQLLHKDEEGAHAV